MTLANLVVEFMASRLTGGLVLDESEVMGCLKKAVRYYAGYSEIQHFARQNLAMPVLVSALGTDVELSLSEWSIIQPLFNAYTDYENALRLEASRGLGLDVYGRSSSEINSDIRQLETDLPRKAFVSSMVTIGNLDVYSTG